MAGPIYSSRVLRVEVGEAGARLACGSNASPGLGVLALARPGDWIWLKPAAEA